MTGSCALPCGEANAEAYFEGLPQSLIVCGLPLTFLSIAPPPLCLMLSRDDKALRARTPDHDRDGHHRVRLLRRQTMNSCKTRAKAKRAGLCTTPPDGAQTAAT